MLLLLLLWWWWWCGGGGGGAGAGAGAGAVGGGGGGAAAAAAAAAAAVDGALFSWLLLSLPLLPSFVSCGCVVAAVAAFADVVAVTGGVWRSKKHQLRFSPEPQAGLYCCQLVHLTSGIMELSCAL